MAIRKDIKYIKERIEKLTDRTIHEAEMYKELKSNLENIELKIKDVRTYVDEYGKVAIKVNYYIPEVKIMFDDNNDVIKNETFYSINILDLLDKEDRNKLYKIISKAKQENELQ